MPRFVCAALVLVASFALAGPASCAVKPNGLFTDGAVLQQGMKVPVWGTANPGEKVTVQFEGQSRTATAGADGRWIVRLNPLRAGGPFTLTIQGENTITIGNVLVGEVWIASGQSNMEWPLKNTEGAEQAMAAAADPMLHLLTVARHAVDQPESDLTASWQAATPETVPNFSAVAYYFARDLRASRKVPIGVISTNVGGTPAEAWTNRNVLWDDSMLRPILESYVSRVADYEKQTLDYTLAAARAKAQNSEPPAPPNPRANPINSQRPAGLYNGMIAPLIPYAFRGAIWYQGESNAGAAYQYRRLFPVMIDDWRHEWAEGDFTFLFVQLAPFMKIQSEPGESNWAELREAQLLTTQVLPKTGMAVITDVGEEDNIHPRKKQPVGARLALAARGIAYGEKIEYSGPTLDTSDVQGNKIIVRFKHAHGLTAPGSAVQGFTIAGADHKFYNAQATIDGERVVVTSDQVPSPIAVRYGWANYPVVNLQNGAGLLASPFRTDDWPITTGPH